MQFCYLCAAPWSPIITHGNCYHRSGCDFNTNCCDDNCLINGLPVCKNIRFTGAPCDGCQFNKDVNTCQHTEWRACNSCLKNAIQCTHWCKECEQLGSLCKPPANENNEHRIISEKDIEEEKKKMELVADEAAPDDIYLDL